MEPSSSLPSHVPNNEHDNEPNLPSGSAAFFEKPTQDPVAVPTSHPYWYVDEDPGARHSQGEFLPADMGEQLAATPYQSSGPQVRISGATAVPSAVAGKPDPGLSHRPRRRPSLLLLAAGVSLLLLLVGGSLLVFAQPLPSLTKGGGTPPVATRGVVSTPIPSPGPSPTTTSAMDQGTALFDWVPSTLPTGWTQAGLSRADALEALRTGWHFTDREMSVDYRSVGARTLHAGTLTAATFLLTPAAKERFAHNDVRVINNVFFDTIVQKQLIRAVVNAQPRLAQFAVQGLHQFVWVDVTFELWQSQIDPAHPTQRLEGKELDEGTHQPRMHHMVVVLVHVPPPQQGPNPPLGGTGWLVTTYALDPGAALPQTVQPV